MSDPTEPAGLASRRVSPDLNGVTTWTDFAARLAELKAWSGRSFETISRVSARVPGDFGIGKGTADNLTKGKVRPQRRSIIGFLCGCGLGDRMREEWLAVFDQLIASDAPIDSGKDAPHPSRQTAVEPVRLAPQLRDLFIAQREDAARHRYQFFDGHVPALPKIYVEQRGEPVATGVGDGGGAAMLLTVPQMLARHANVIVVSGPGMGKSTMVMQIQHQQACWWLSSTTAEEQRSGPFGRVLPVTVPAGLLVERSLSEAVSEVARRLGCRYTLRSLFDPLPMSEVAWLIMIDGIDEVLTRQERSTVLTKVAHGIEHAAPWMRFLVASRPLPFGDLAEIRAQRVGEFVLRHFDDKNLIRATG